MIVGPWALPDPWDWQLREQREHGEKPKRALFASPRLGKTNAVALLLRTHGESGRIKRGLVVAPLKVCPIWSITLEQAGIAAHHLYDLTPQKIERLFEGRAWNGVAIVNRDKLAYVIEALGPLDAFMADECHNYAAVSSMRARAYRRVARTTPWVRALSGTPVPRHYGSLWSQLAPLAPGAWPSSFEAFARRYLVRDHMFRSRVLAHINVEELRALVLDVASIYRREDVFGPDSYQPVLREVDMPERAWKLYHQLAREWILDEPEFERAIVAGNAAVRLMRLQQLTSGFVPSGEHGEPHPLHQAKVDAVIADLDEILRSDEKVVIFHRFVHEGRVMHDQVRVSYPDAPVFKIDGSKRRTADQDREVMETFNATEGAAVIVVQIQSGSEGISLREGRHLMYLSRTFSFTDDEQSRDRVYKPGEPRTVTYYDVPGTVDLFVSNLLRDKRDLHEAIRHADRRELAYGSIRKHTKSRVA